MSCSHRGVHRVRQWAAGITMAAGAAVSAAMLGMTSAPCANADTGGEVIDQAIANQTQGVSVLDAAPTALLGAQESSLLDTQVTAIQENPFFTEILSAQANLPVADQTFLADADQTLVTATQGVLSADDAFVAADQAGELSSPATSLPAALGLLDADLGLLPAAFEAQFATIAADLASDVGLSF
jgi:hypothetical protein